MKKSLFVLVSTLTVFCLCFSLTAYAETTPVFEAVPTDNVYATEAATDYVDDPDYTEYTEAPTEDPYAPTNPVDTEAVDTAPTEYTEPYTTEVIETTVEDEEPTVIHTNPPAPTEPDEDSTYSDYVSPDPIYTPADQDFEKKDWQEIKLDLKADPAPGKQSFADIQNDTSKGNDSIAGFLIAGLALIFLSIAGFTFVFLYNPYKKKKAPAKAGVNAGTKSGTRYAGNSSKSNRRTESNKPTFNPDDYNDGF